MSNDRYRKKPVVIHAYLMKPDRRDWPDWLLEGWNDGTLRMREWGLECVTLEGVMAVSDGDWIIKGVKGELYPCKPDVFAATYEPAGAENG